MRRLSLLIPLLVLAFPSAASAADVSFGTGNSRKLEFIASGNETNRLTVAVDGLTVTFRDLGATIDDHDDCVDVSASEVRCTLPSADYRVKVDAGDGDDEVTVAGSGALVSVDGGIGNDVLTGAGADDELAGGAGDDRLAGGGGIDKLDGGEGNDTLAARDGVRDTVVCGLGDDAGEADVEDDVNADCERVDKPLAPPTVADAPEDEQAAPAPVAGRRVSVAVKDGVVLARKPGATTFKPLDPAAPVPVGTTLDARNGTLTLTSLADTTGRTQSADITGAKFSVSQRRSRRMYTVLTLKGGDFRSCAPKASAATARAAGARRVRRLWGSGHGRFVTKGRTSAATVRGTVWSVEDRCDGTLTRVSRGLVSVRDFARHRSRLVRRGERYFARAR